MRITLRKKDSVTSTVLFLFNILGEYKKDHSIKLKDLLGLMRHFGKSEVSVRTGLSRMVKANLLVNSREGNDTVYTLTEEGLYNISLWNNTLRRGFKRSAQRSNSWDQQWRFITIIDFNKSDYANQFIIEELEECGLREINNNIWITPYSVDADITDLLEKQNLKYLKFSGSLDSNMDISEFFGHNFNLASSRQGYIQFLDKARKYSAQIEILKIEQLFPVLFEAGWDFSDLVAQDPMLPKELLPTWEGDEAVMEMKKIRSAILPKLIDFLKENNI